MAQSSARGVLEVCSKHLAQLHLVNAATAFHRIAKAAKRPDSNIYIYIYIEREREGERERERERERSGDSLVGGTKPS